MAWPKLCFHTFVFSLWPCLLWKGSTHVKTSAPRVHDLSGGNTNAKCFSSQSPLTLFRATQSNKVPRTLLLRFFKCVSTILVERRHSQYVLPPTRMTQTPEYLFASARMHASSSTRTHLSSSTGEKLETFMVKFFGHLVSEWSESGASRCDKFFLGQD